MKPSRPKNLISILIQASQVTPTRISQIAKSNDDMDIGKPFV